MTMSIGISCRELKKLIAESAHQADKSPAAPGGISDILSRIAAQRLSAHYNQQVIVENRTGSGGHVAGDFVAKAVPDGYTLLQATIAHNAAFAMYLALTYDPAQDLQPIVLLGESQGVLLVHPSLPVRSVKEFVALAKARPGELNYGSAGAGTAIHMATELFKWMAKVDLTHIAYKGSTPAMIDLIGGRMGQPPGGFPRAWLSPQGAVFSASPNSSFNAIPLLVQMYRLAKDEKYLAAALRAAEFTFSSLSEAV